MIGNGAARRVTLSRNGVRNANGAFRPMSPSPRLGDSARVSVRADRDSTLNQLTRSGASTLIESTGLTDCRPLLWAVVCDVECGNPIRLCGRDADGVAEAILRFATRRTPCDRQKFGARRWLLRYVCGTSGAGAQGTRTLYLANSAASRSRWTWSDERRITRNDSSVRPAATLSMTATASR
jgi:hypothetical protein